MKRIVSFKTLFNTKLGDKTAWFARAGDDLNDNLIRIYFIKDSKEYNHNSNFCQKISKEDLL